ncbi:hypothetical protein K1719_045368 [Acacia pycnantha]|nr:hypothetical protein K1719_045368 [Acacia pycnantha]
MASAAESFEKVYREIANLNERIRVLEQNTSAMKKFIMKGLVPANRVLEQNTSAMKEFIKEAIVQGNWHVRNSGRPVTGNALGSSVVGAEEKTVIKGFESDNSNMEPKPEEMGGTGREEGIPLQRTQRRFRVNFGCGPGSEGAEVCEGVVLKTQGIEIVETFFVTDLAIADVVLVIKDLLMISSKQNQRNNGNIQPQRTIKHHRNRNTHYKNVLQRHEKCKKVSVTKASHSKYGSKPTLEIMPKISL